jgi:hypothetical protein
MSSNTKSTLVIFLDCAGNVDQGFIPPGNVDQEFIPPGETVNQQYYREFLQSLY